MILLIETYEKLLQCHPEFIEGRQISQNSHFDWLSVTV